MSTPTQENTTLKVLVALSFCHLMNDMIQSLVPAIYPILKENLQLSFTQIGMITFFYSITASLLQPMVGHYTDRNQKPYSLAIGMSFTLIGLLALAFSSSFITIAMAASCVGIGSSIFHPESSRMARIASGGRHGFAQSLFQVGGNVGTATGPLLAAFIILKHGQESIAWFSIAALMGIIVLIRIGKWYQNHKKAKPKTNSKATQPHNLSKQQVRFSMLLLMLLVFSKYFYMTSITNYYTFYLIDRFHISIQSAQLHLFAFLAAIAFGTLAGGHIGDTIGRKKVIWFSILGILPFTLLLPYVNLLWTEILSVIIGTILASAFSAILVYAHELMPGKVGTISGLFFGLAFGFSAIAAALLGRLADKTSIDFVYHICAFLPLIGIVTYFLPNVKKAA